jgi:hypothetical protein
MSSIGRCCSLADNIPNTPLLHRWDCKTDRYIGVPFDEPPSGERLTVVFHYPENRGMGLPASSLFVEKEAGRCRWVQRCA